MAPPLGMAYVLVGAGLCVVVGWYLVSEFGGPTGGAPDSGDFIAIVDDPTSTQPLHLDPADVQAKAPYLADALRAAATAGSGEIREPNHVSSTWSYLDQLTGKQDRVVRVEFEGRLWRLEHRIL